MPQNLDEKLRKLYQGIQIAANTTARPKVPGLEALVDDVAAALVAHFAGAPMVEPPPPSPKCSALQPRPLAGGPQHSVPESDIIAPPSPPPFLPFNRLLSMDSLSSTTFSIQEELDDEGQVISHLLLPVLPLAKPAKTCKTTRKTKKPAASTIATSSKTAPAIAKVKVPVKAPCASPATASSSKNLLLPIATPDESLPSAFSTPVPVPKRCRVEAEAERTL
ncbi:hypothetical protein BKA70DRAFT_1427923 [Coprinopsis sp. MPI-PUGE-AT-0042]|nr:hypothetical protein BKA70DRAFT_1427923 [Coprinopsis sp. MPI-PUGE-AT-0042]